MEQAKRISTHSNSINFTAGTNAHYTELSFFFWNVLFKNLRDMSATWNSIPRKGNMHEGWGGGGEDNRSEIQLYWPAENCKGFIERRVHGD